ncbi:uncharacterized protein OCT59_000724 [Rhizophagus irregularis]|uniref:uncharacterized protein n=1 Tax=Rhizophagus irregularis TaxID=588596 RepID=UPI003332CFD4|nr:hypothetical protein OCT59_000724 [Rhizophagus irregularis]
MSVFLDAFSQKETNMLLETTFYYLLNKLKNKIFAFYYHLERLKAAFTTSFHSARVFFSPKILYLYLINSDFLFSLLLVFN